MAKHSITIIAGGFRLPEGARWHDGSLWFVDMLLGNVHRLTDGFVEQFASFGRPSSLGFRPNGEMLIVDASTSTLYTYRNGELADSLKLDYRLNDMAIDPSGRAYIDGGQLDGFRPAGHVLLVPPSGEPRIVAEHILAANGIGVSPDGRTLVVAESWGPNGALTGARLFGFDIEEDGSLSNRRVVATIDRGSGDGLCFDAEGGLWVCTAVRERGAAHNRGPRRRPGCISGPEMGIGLCVGRP